MHQQTACVATSAVQVWHSVEAMAADSARSTAELGSLAYAFNVARGVGNKRIEAAVLKVITVTLKNKRKFPAAPEIEEALVRLPSDALQAVVSLQSREFS